MGERVQLHVYRRLDNRSQVGPDADDQSPVGWELHRRRSAALHDVFDDVPGVTVTNWGVTDDEKRTHELTVLGVEIDPSAMTALAPVGGVVLAWVGRVLHKYLTDQAAEGLKWLLGKLRRKQDEQKIADFTLFHDGSFVVRVDPSGRGSGEIEARLPDGRLVQASWGMTEDQLPALEPSKGDPG